jgi:phage I-like protein
VQRLLFPKQEAATHKEVLLALRDYIALEKDKAGKGGNVNKVTAAEMFARFGVTKEVFSARVGIELEGEDGALKTLSADTLSICRQLGITPEEFTGAPKGGDGSLKTLSADDMSICQQLGIAPEKFVSTK